MGGENIIDEDFSYYIDMFPKKYHSSRSFITYIEEFGSICISLISKENTTFVYCRSILGLLEFEYTNSQLKEEQILFMSFDKYFRHFINNWDLQLNTRSTLFDNVFSFLTSNIVSLTSNRTRQPLNNLIKTFVLSNINKFKIENLKNRISELNYFYAEEIENFILRDFLEIELKNEKIEDVKHFDELNVTSEDLENLGINYKNIENGLSTVIHELISTELEVLIIMNKMYYNGILIQKEKLEIYKFNEYFKDFEKLYFLSKRFVSDLVNTFNMFKYKKVDYTLQDIFKPDKNQEYSSNFDEYKNLDFKFDQDTYKFNETSNADLTSNLDLTSNADLTLKLDEYKENKIIFVNDENDLTEKLSTILYKNLEYFYSFKNFSIFSESILKNCKIKNFNIDLLRDTFNIMTQRLTKYNALLSKILSYTHPDSLGYLPLKFFLIKIRKFVLLCDNLTDIQFKKEKTWELCIKYDLYDVKDLYIDEITSDKYKLILIADYILILNLNGKLLDIYNVETLDIHENGNKSFFLITNRKSNITLHYKYEYEDYSMYVMRYKCMSRGIRDRIVFNLRHSKKKFNKNQREIIKKIEREKEVFGIPYLYQKDEDWILMKYRLIMNEILEVNENLKIKKF
ncbi:putative Rho guanine nucleotide exchange factor [Vairimorpha necatrix]|uniref:Rho guanine nucleotide exchange factor n=1 Tax=Vairimorpha necatrix TaxID=6039 RepID=A0AAX4JDM9_9MICR